MNTQLYPTVYGTLLEYGFEHVLLILRFVDKYCFGRSFFVILWFENEHQK
jgi:hypothetical protein